MFLSLSSLSLPRCVDDDDVLPHLADVLPVDEVPGGVQQGDVDGDEVGVAEEVVELHVLRVGDGGDPVVRGVGVVAEDLVHEAGDLLDGLLADQPGADDADLCRIRLLAFGIT